MNNIQKYRDEFEALVSRGEKILKDMKACYEAGQSDQALVNPNLEYQLWYTQSQALVSHLLPVRLDEFEQLYDGAGNNDSSIRSWLNGTIRRYEEYPEMAGGIYIRLIRQFENQIYTLRSLECRLESALFDIRLLVQADLFDSELESASELNRLGFLRAAGAVAGVVLEKHLAQVAENHNINIGKRNPTIGDYNDLLKAEAILDVASWRQIQWLGDIRNLCTHNKDKDPTRDEVEGLISGVEKYIKNLF